MLSIVIIFIYRFLQHILKKMSEGIEITKEMLGKSKEELYKKYGENEEKIASLKHKQQQVKVL